MFIDFLEKTFEVNHDRDAIIWRDTVYNYRWLLDRVHYWREALNHRGLSHGTITVLEGDFSPNSVALFLALIDHGCIVVPLTSSVGAEKNELVEIAQGELLFVIGADDDVTLGDLQHCATHELYSILRQNKHPGLVLFSSGSTGKSKAVVHDLARLLEKFKVPRRSLRIITFLLYDHWGGLNTMFYALSNGGCVVNVQDRNPDAVLSAIARYKVELLPTTPTFINLVILSESYCRHDLSSLRTVTYGTEPMPESTLKRFHELFPNVSLLQTYGLSEVGVLRSKSRSSSSLWVKVGGEGFQTRVVDGILHIKADSAMLGYLNAPNPFTEDGWLNTGDCVVTDGEYIKILGRKSEIINVGGQKVYPAEVESGIQEMDGVEDVAVSGEPNPITGQMVTARIKISTEESLSDFRNRMRAFCKGKLASYKIPQKVALVDKPLHGERFKKVRRESAQD
jgi:acyl-CoA synthetase (AMP-forming)/AMP-acid ligase II